MFVVLTPCPPGPPLRDRDLEDALSSTCTSTSSASGMTATVAGRGGCGLSMPSRGTRWTGATHLEAELRSNVPSAVERARYFLYPQECSR